MNRYDLVILLFYVSISSSRSLEKITTTTAATTTNHAVATTEGHFTETTTKSRYEQGLEDYDEAKENIRQSRGMMMMMDEDDYHNHHEKEKQEEKAVKEDPWAGYYDFVINEASFKFWAAFQLVTAVLLIYSAFAAVYYAKFNVITTDYDYYDDFFARSNSDATFNTNWSGLSAQTFQRIVDAWSSKKYL